MEGYDGELQHIGIKRKSGRYPWGSGNNPYQRSRDFKAYVDEMKSKGMKPTEIAEAIQAIGRKSDPHFSFSTTDLRAGISVSTDEIRAANVATARKLKEKQMSTSAIAEQMLGDRRKESTVRGWLKESEDLKDDSLRAVAESIKQQASEKPYLDVGKGNHLYMGVSETKFKVAIAMLRDEGYSVHPIKIPQLGTDKLTNTLVLTKGDVSWADARKAVVNDGQLQVITSQSDDGGLTFRTPKSMPVSLPSKRVAVRYDEDGGTTMDGVIELRRGVSDLDLQGARYAQVRIAVDGTHFLKGMAMYADDLPAGVDVRFNTNKSKNDPKVLADGKLGAMKPLKADKDGVVDPANPFGASTYPHMYVDKNGKEKQSSLNIVGAKGAGNIEGRWDQWSRNLSSQMLSKQPVALASAQLTKARTAKEEELDRIKSLTNPVVRQKLLDEFADSADAAAVHLKAAQMPRQSTHVILPMNSMRPHEIYAPNFDNGDKVVLVRHPHGGPFEIPELTVNNKNSTAKRILGGALDAVGIHHTVASQLSGADFDGDTVLVIPNNEGRVKTRPPLEGLKGFDPQAQYKISPDDKTTTRMTKKNTQTEMGKISNLITDMTIRGADDNELAAAVRHSMVVIDAEKHGLDYKQSAKDNGIAKLKADYQGGANKGAATLISRASSDKRIPQQKLRPAADGGPIDKKTGELVYVKTGATYPKKVPKTNPKTGEVEYVPTGEIIAKTTKGSRMELTKDARKLSSGTPMEEVYASHANAMKAMANEARRVSVNTMSPKYSADAKRLYKDEVDTLEQKLQTAQRNAPLERRAQTIGKALAKARIDSDPSLDKDDIKKINYQSLEEGRNITGANKAKVYIEDREWAAIQAGAIASSRLREILTNSDMDRVKTLATPKYRSSLTPGQLAKAKQMASSGRGMSEIAEALGLPRSTVADNLANA